MLVGKIKEYLFLSQIKRKLEKYHIDLIHFIPGRIRLQSNRWKTDSALLEKLVKKLQAKPMVVSVESTRLTGSLLIIYNPSYITSMRELDSWFQVLDQVYRQ